jgi:hypothetical protein
MKVYKTGTALQIMSSVWKDSCMRCSYVHEKVQCRKSEKDSHKAFELISKWWETSITLLWHSIQVTTKTFLPSSPRLRRPWGSHLLGGRQEFMTSQLINKLMSCIQFMWRWDITILFTGTMQRKSINKNAVVACTLQHDFDHRWHVATCNLTSYDWFLFNTDLTLLPILKDWWGSEDLVYDDILQAVAKRSPVCCIPLLFSFAYFVFALSNLFNTLERLVLFLYKSIQAFTLIYPSWEINHHATFRLKELYMLGSMDMLLQKIKLYDVIPISVQQASYLVKIQEFPAQVSL